jgi:hypothetical protein
MFRCGNDCRAACSSDRRFRRARAWNCVAVSRRIVCCSGVSEFEEHRRDRVVAPDPRARRRDLRRRRHRGLREEPRLPDVGPAHQLEARRLERRVHVGRERVAGVVQVRVRAEQSWELEDQRRAMDLPQPDGRHGPGVEPPVPDLPNDLGLVALDTAGVDP